MPPNKVKLKGDTVPCSLSDGMAEMVEEYAEALRTAAPTIGDHGLAPDEFWSSGLFRSAIERLRGQQAAATKDKYDFIKWALEQLKAAGVIEDFKYTGAGDRHDFHIYMPSERVCVVEAKGCLDGNNTTIYERPPNADEFMIWSLCQSQGSNLRAGVWSGAHSRIGGSIIATNVHVEALIVWDALCGGPKRPCPKIAEGRGVEVDGVKIPPPCIYLFPRTIPDPRNNPKPFMVKLPDVALASALLKHFGGDDRDVTEVQIEARMKGTNLQRQTTLIRSGRVVKQSNWTKLNRANR